MCNIPSTNTDPQYREHLSWRMWHHCHCQIICPVSECPGMSSFTRLQDASLDGENWGSRQRWLSSNWAPPLSKHQRHSWLRNQDVHCQYGWGGFPSYFCIIFVHVWGVVNTWTIREQCSMQHAIATHPGGAGHQTSAVGPWERGGGRIHRCLRRFARQYVTKFFGNVRSLMTNWWPKMIEIGYKIWRWWDSNVSFFDLRIWVPKQTTPTRRSHWSFLRPKVWNLEPSGLCFAGRRRRTFHCSWSTSSGGSGNRILCIFCYILLKFYYILHIVKWSNWDFVDI